MAEKEQQAIAFLKSLGYSIIPPQTMTFERVLNKWIEYKRERHQTYKPRGLEALRKRLISLSGGNPQLALAIVEQSMANNYAGLFPLKQNHYEQQSIVNKVTAILSE